LDAEARAVLRHAVGDATSADIVLAIPNQLPEESQDALLTRLPPGTRLVWRSVAAAMMWAEANSRRVNAATQLIVLDASLHGVEKSVFEFRQQEAHAHVFQIPVRRLNRLNTVNTGCLLADSPAPFLSLQIEMNRLEQHLDEIVGDIDGDGELIICGPLADSMSTLLRRRLPRFHWPSANVDAVARGAALFASRLASGSPTYLDVLPSLELFTLTEEHEPSWLQLIPIDCEVEGGQGRNQHMERRIFIEKGTARLASWLQRSGESVFRKLTTELPVQAAQNAWVDLHVTARSAGGFASVRMVPSRREFDIFGIRGDLLLNWQSMKRLPHGPAERWPPNMVKFGWPACGKLYAHRRFFEEFLAAASDVESILELRDIRQRLPRIVLLKERVRQTIAPHLAGIRGEGGDTAPVNLLVCFSTDASCEFLEATYSGQSRVTTPLPTKQREARAAARLLWQRLKEIGENPKAAKAEINALVYVLGRMGGLTPDAFSTFISDNFHPTSKSTLLFAAGRVLQTPEHGQHLFATLKAKADLCQTLNNNWLRMLVYVLYQRPDILREVPREHCEATARLCLERFKREVDNANVRILFMNSLRALALLLRARRHSHARDFLVQSSCPEDEAHLARRIRSALLEAGRLRLRAAPRMLLDRTKEWLNQSASTDEMPPIAPPDEECEPEGSEDD
jgi:hypothetical protein